MHPVDPWLVIFLAVFQLVLGGGLGFRIGVVYVLRRIARRRRDEAEQFEAGDLITFGDGSSMRVVAVTPNGGDHHG